MVSKRKIRIKRKGFYVRPTTYYRRGKRIKRKGFRVKPTSYVRKAKGICPLCGRGVFAQGKKIKGRWFHKKCAYITFLRIPRK